MSTDHDRIDVTVGQRRSPVDRLVAQRYRLGPEIGRGGMGSVWLARDEVLGRDVAVKRVGMLPGVEAPDLARAEREARLAAGLNHPHVVAVFDLVAEADEHWLVMEYVQGRTLTQLVEEHGPLNPDHAAHLLAQAAAALTAAHADGVVHRDVKPSNILVTDDGTVKLTDFGIARGRTDVTLTRTGLMSGSPAYLSPEVAAGRASGEPTDVWALGATLYHALTGRPPYEVDGNVVAVLYRIVHEPPPRPPDAGWLQPVLEGTMHSDPQARWTMAQVSDFLRSSPDERPTMPAAPAPAIAAGVPAGPAPQPRPSGAAHPTPAAPAPGAERRASRLPVVTGLVLIALVLGALVWSAVRDSTHDGRDGDGASAGQDPTQDPADDGPTDGDGASRSVDDEMRAFVEDYLALVTTDPRSAWARLTPRFQEASGGFGEYRRWWGQVGSASLVDVRTSPGDMTVSYTVRYEMRNGSTRTDDVVLVLARDGEELLIAGEP